MKNLMYVMLLGTFVLGTAVAGFAEAAPDVNGKAFALKVDRAADTFKVTFPHDPIADQLYAAVEKGAIYAVTFAKDGNRVTIEPGTIQGVKRKAVEGQRSYALTKGVFAGGRFVVREEKGDLQGELTIYGSGRPVIKSERGKLTPKK